MSVNLKIIRELVEQRKDNLPVNVDELPEQWQYIFEERAAIREYDGGQSREQAEAAALAETQERMRLAE